MVKPLLERITNKEILKDSELYKEIQLLKADNERLVMDLNSHYRKPDEVNQLLAKMTDKHVNQTNRISLPFYTDFGKHIHFGRNIFINQNVTFVDLGGIYIEDNVLIGPMSRIVTVNHLIEPEKREGLWVKPVRIKRNVWLGANVTILPGVTVGENSIVSADATVTKDVPSNVIVAGTPAKIIKHITS